MEKVPFSIYDFFGYLASGIIISVVADHILGYGWVLRENMPAAQAVFLVVIVYIIGHINANISSWLLEQNLIAKLLRHPNEILFTDKKNLPWLPRFIFPGYHTPIPWNLIERIAVAAKNRGVPVGGENFFHHVRTIAKGSKETWTRMDTFLQLYGFCRNVSFSLFVSALLLAIAWLRYDARENGFLSILSLLFSIGMLYRYLKFYRQYSFEMFTAYPELATQPTQKGE